MPNPFSKKSVPDSVKEEIRARASKQGILWTAKRFPWIHITSLCDGCTEYINLSSIKGGTLYTQSYVRPKPVVTQVDVKKQGELGTTRRANISITAFTDKQLEELTNCYFIPGMGVRVEWGWSESATGKGNPPTISDRTLTDAQAVCLINKQAKDYPNYNGLQGVVANFSYNLNDSGYWDCTLEIIAAAEAVIGTKANEYGCPDCAREYENETPEGGSKKVVEVRSTLYTLFKDLYESYFKAVTVYKNAYKVLTGDTSTPLVTAQYNYNGPARTEKGSDNPSWYEGSFLGITFNKPDTTEPFISWATLEEAINICCLPTSNNKYVLGRLFSNKMKLKGHPQVESTDPRICIIPGTKKASQIATKISGTEINAIEDGYVILDNIMVNTVFLMNELRQVEEQEGTLRAFLTNVLAKINEACGNLWEFEIVSTTEDCTSDTQDPTLAIIDAKVYDPAEAYEIPSLPFGTEQSVIRNLKLDLKMTEQMKTQALYSNARPMNVTTDSGGGCGSNGFAPFGMSMDGKFSNLAVPKATDPAKCACEGASVKPTEKPPTFDEIFEDLGDNVGDSTVSAAKAALIKAYADSIKDKKDTHCIGMPIPFEFSFTLDGIGGFAFGQAVSTNRLPPKLREAYDFQVTAVEHSVTPNDWTTTVNTIFRYK